MRPSLVPSHDMIGIHPGCISSAVFAPTCIYIYIYIYIDIYVNVGTFHNCGILFILNFNIRFDNTAIFCVKAFLEMVLRHYAFTLLSRSLNLSR